MIICIGLRSELAHAERYKQKSTFKDCYIRLYNTEQCEAVPY